MNIIRFLSIVKLIACTSVFGLITLAQAQSVPPPARVENVTEEHYGVKVVDPYRWLENLKSEETQKWMRAQADYAENYLNKLPLREEILRRLNDISSAEAAVRGIQKRGERFFYLRRAADEQDFKLYVRQGLAGAEKLLVDPNKVLQDGKRYSLGNWSPSADGKYVAYNIAPSGSEIAELFVVETASGRDLGVRIWGTPVGTPSWLPDNKSFFYARMQKLAADAPAVEKYRKLRTYLHRLGENPSGEGDRSVFGYGTNAEIPGGIDMLWNVETRPGWDFALATMWTGVTPDREYYVAPLSSLNQQVVPWRKLVGFADEVSAVSIRGDDLFLLTYKQTPRYKILRTSFKQPDLKRAETVVPATEAVITRLAAQPDALYVNTLDAGNYRIHRVDYKSKKSAPVLPPYDGAAYLAVEQPNENGIYFNVQSWTKSLAHFKYDPRANRAETTNLIPSSPVDMSHVEFKNAMAESHDGVMVPLVIIYKKGLQRDGRNPVLMNGYGAYGFENVSPFFFRDLLPWVERGGVYVFTGVRGGGEYGEEWHKAGFQQTKPNTWKDFIACAEYLIREKYTAPELLTIKGASAGGILISNSIAERPDLFAAAIINVGMTNAVRAETTANGIVNVPQFGSVKTEAGFRALLAMDGYLKIRDGARYPAVLLTHGVNDPRVDVWMSSKMAARLQAASSSGKPVLLRLDYDAGHGVGSTKEQHNKQLADEYAFLFRQVRAKE